jgi:hypothetical protein
MAEYATSLGGDLLASLTSFDPSLNVILMVGGFIFFFWFFAFKA